MATSKATQRKVEQEAADLHEDNVDHAQELARDEREQAGGKVGRSARETLTGRPELQPGQDGYVSATAQAFEDQRTDDDKRRMESGRAPGTLHVGQLDKVGEIAARTGPDAEADGKYRHTFVLSGRDWDANADNDDMHRANQVATLQMALNAGLHPQGEAARDGDIERTADGSVRVTYAVEVIPAHMDEEPAGAFVPARAIREMGGSTVEHAQNDVTFGTHEDRRVDDAGVSA